MPATFASVAGALTAAPATIAATTIGIASASVEVAVAACAAAPLTADQMPR